MNQFARWLCAMALGVAPFAVAQTQDATALEAQYKTCAKHYIPADKCTPEIYQQLKDKDNAPLDPTTTTALKAIKDYQGRLNNPDSMQVRTAHLTDQGAVCLEVGGQNGAGGMTVSRVVYITPEWKGAKRLKGHWFDEGGVGGEASRNVTGGMTDRWPSLCEKTKFGSWGGPLLPGTDVTEKVNQALKEDARFAASVRCTITATRVEMKHSSP
jgi:hypothetical protein